MLTARCRTPPFSPSKNVVAPLLAKRVLMFRMLTAVPPLIVVVTVAAGADEAMVKVLADPMPLIGQEVRMVVWVTVPDRA